MTCAAARNRRDARKRGSAYLATAPRTPRPTDLPLPDDLRHEPRPLPTARRK